MLVVASSSLHHDVLSAGRELTNTSTCKKEERERGEGRERRRHVNDLHSKYELYKSFKPNVKFRKGILALKCISASER